MANVTTSFASLVDFETSINTGVTIGLSSALSWAQAAYDYANYFPVSYYTYQASTQVSGILSNGDSLTAFGSNLLGYPHTITRADYHFSSNIGNVSMYGSVYYPAYGVYPSGTLTKIEVSPNSGGKITINGSDNVAVAGDASITSVVWTNGGVTATVTGSIYGNVYVGTDGYYHASLSGTATTLSIYTSTTPSGYLAPPSMTVTGAALSAVTLDAVTNANDLLVAALSGADTVNGGNGSEMLWGYAGNDVLAGGLGNDTLDGGAGNDTMAGGAGHDTYVVDSANDVVQETAGNGTDVVQAGVGYTLATGVSIENLILTGLSSINGTGNELANAITGNGGNNVLDGGAGRDLLNGQGGIDTVSYATSAIQIIAATGNGNGSALDWQVSDGSWVESINLESLISIESLSGGSGNDTLLGDNGANVLTGNGGSDHLYGLAGDDSLIGGTGNDFLQGGNGNDTLVGGTGSDVLIGGYGADQFVFETALDAANNLDTIKDFASGSDKIVLENAVLTALASTGALNVNFFHAGAGVTTSADANDFLIYDNTAGALYYDPDGTGAVSPTQFATLTGHPAILAGDFVVT